MLLKIIMFVLIGVLLSTHAENVGTNLCSQAECGRKNCCLLQIEFLMYNKFVKAVLRENIVFQTTQ